MSVLNWSRILIIAIAALVLTGCAGKVGGSPYTDGGGVVRNSERARELVAQAKIAAESDSAKSETLLREALAADLYCGAAHNNLGVLLLDRGALYEAAGEFEWAKKLMPGHPDPRVNLAMTLEKAGKTDEALSAYDSALAVYDEYLPALQGKTRLEVDTGRSGPGTLAALEDISLRGDESWRTWAQLWRVKLVQAP